MKAVKAPFAGRFDEDRNDIGYDYRRRVGAYVRQLRLNAGLTQQELGRAVDMGGSMISAIELGRNPIPPERYRVFASTLGVPDREFGMFLLEHTDPWVCGMIFGRDKVAHHHLNKIPTRINKSRKQSHKKAETMKQKVDRIRKNHGAKSIYGA